jgi:FkbH-like protein
MLTRDMVFLVYRLLLRRDPENEDVVAVSRQHASLEAMAEAIRASDEYRSALPRPPLVPYDWSGLKRPLPRGEAYLAPLDLRQGPARPVRALVVGQCVFDTWRGAIATHHPDAELDHVVFNHFSGPPTPPHPVERYDFQLIQIPLRPSLLQEVEYLTLDYEDEAAHEQLLERVIERLDLILDTALALSDRIPAFVMNYMRPQANPLGRLLPRYDLRNQIHFIERLNRALAERVARHGNCHLLDLDHLAGVFGRRFVQDDAVWIANHGGLINDYDASHDGDRLIPAGKLSEQYDLDVAGFVRMAWDEAVAMHATLRGVESVKMLCVDLDDTLWRGVLAEQQGGDRTEGWPLGIAEALSYLKKRGIILAAVSKNDEGRIRELWDHAIGDRFGIDAFAIRKINWNPKPDNIIEAIREANILSSSVVFLDDNPVEREAVRAALPEVRVIDASHYYWKRILLWSAETQPAAISTESARRGEMIQAQVQREEVRSKLSREEFLAALDIAMELFPIAGTEDPDFARAFELLNKTNQFNTTGRRWTHGGCLDFFAQGGRLWAFRVQDRFTRYGVVGVLATRGGLIEQFVMSCRVIGLDVEMAALATVFAREATPEGLAALAIETPANLLSRDLFRRCGWRPIEDRWHGATMPPAPEHIRLRLLDRIGATA